MSENMDEKESDDKGKEDVALQMFYFRKTVIFMGVSFVAIIALFFMVILAWSIYKGESAPNLEGVLSLLQTISGLFEKFMESE